jgi:DNA polymerase IV
VTLKLKSGDFRLRTRSHSLDEPTRLASRLFDVGRHMLARELDGTRFRLIGIGVSELTSAGVEAFDLVDPGPARHAAAEEAMDRVRSRFGRDAVQRGLGFTPKAKD